MMYLEMSTNNSLNHSGITWNITLILSNLYPKMMLYIALINDFELMIF